MENQQIYVNTSFPILVNAHCNKVNNVYIANQEWNIQQAIKPAEIEKNITYKSAWDLGVHEWKTYCPKKNPSKYLKANNAPFCAYNLKRSEPQKNDCSVRALGTVMGWDYDYTEKKILELKKQEEWGDGGATIDIMERLLPSDHNIPKGGGHGVTIPCKNASLVEIARETPLGLITIKTGKDNYHSLPCLEGVIYDQSYCDVFNMIVFGAATVYSLTIPNLSSKKMEARAFAAKAKIESQAMNYPGTVTPVFKLKDNFFVPEKAIEL